MSSTRLQPLARFLTRRSRLVIGVWIVAVAVLGFVGRNLENELALHSLFIDGTQSKRAHEIAQREFGGDNAMVVMLRGPRRAVDSQGRELAARLGSLPRMLVVSPWAHGATVAGLRPRPGTAAMLVQVESKGGTDTVSGLLPPVQHWVHVVVKGPVRASVAGFPVVVNSIRSASHHATVVGELVALPVLLLVLLLVFRSVVAALLPLVVGGSVVTASHGILSLLAGPVEIDLFAAGVAGMMGLALGVDYSLLVVSRFREREPGGDVAVASRETMVAATRSVVPAGTGLILAMLVATVLLPGVTVRSVAIAVSLVTFLSVASAVLVVPALLNVLGDNLERWSLPRREAPGSALLFRVRRLADRPRLVAAIFALLVFSAAWAFTLDTGLTTAALLPPGDNGRQQQEAVEGALGPGWASPTEVVVNGHGRPVTSPRRLHELVAFQRRVERDPGVQSMVGLVAIERGARQLEGVEGALADQERGLARLRAGIAKAHRGSERGTLGLRQAAAGSRGLASGVAAAGAGSGVLADGLEATSTGSSRLSSGLDRADRGSGRLAHGTSEASSGAGKLAAGLSKAREETGQLTGSARLLRNAMDSGSERLGELHAPLHETEEQLAAALAALRRMSVGRGDPEYDAALRAVEAAGRRLTGRDPSGGELLDPSYAGVTAGVESAEGQFDVGLYLASRLRREGREASQGIAKLAKGSERLDHGLRGLARGSQQVSAGIAALHRGSERLSPALRKLSDGAVRLTNGLVLLENGSSRLAGGLGDGVRKFGLLAGGLGRIEGGLERERGPDSTASRLDLLRRRSPGMFKSAYFVLAALDGSRFGQRRQINSLIDLDRGGMDARMLVIPREGPTGAGAVGLKERLEGDAGGLARRTGTEVAVGGVGPTEIDVNDAIRGQAPVIRLVLSLVSFLILVPVMRSLVMPAIAAAINALTVSAAFGVLSLLFNGSLLGGPGYVDTTVLFSAMMVMFGLAIDYEVFVFARMREEYVRTGSPAEAVERGLDRTAHVITGAAVIMVSVFLAFSVSEFMSMRNFGIAQAVAILIDAFVVRLVVIPVVMNRLGRAAWWMPRWLDRLLPGFANPS